MMDIWENPQYAQQQRGI